MSKGPGKAQRRILAELEARPAFYLDELAVTRADNVSLNRAAWKLSEAGLIQLTRYLSGKRKIFITRPGASIDRMTYNRREYDWQNRKQIISVE